MLRTLRLRLLAMILIVLAPLAAFISIGARNSYDTALSALRTSEISVAGNIDMQLRVALAISRHVLVTLMAIAEIDTAETSVCDRILTRTLSLSPAPAAIRIRPASGGACQAVKPEHQAELPALLALFDRIDTAGPAHEILPDHAGNVWFDSGRTPGGAYFLVRVEEETPAGRMTGEMAVDAMRLAAEMDGLTAVQGGTVAAFGADPAPLFVKGTEESGSGWLPAATSAVLAAGQPVDLPAHDGKSRTYIRKAIAGDRLYFIAGFRGDMEQDLQSQFLAFLLAPLATLLVLWFAYSRMIRLHVLRWTNGLAEAARQVAANRAARAPDSDAMPSELQDVGKSFNAMLDRQADRERSLEEALARNQYLSRELHHRVKNSLQIVQSYLGLAKRSEDGAARRALLITECRVNALSTAYRLALAEGELKETPIDDYLEAVAANVAALMRSAGQSVRSHFDLRMKSQIDLATPLGLIIVEALVELLGASGTTTISIEGTRQENGERRLTISSDAGLPERPLSKLLLGLIQQAEAVALPRPNDRVFLLLGLSGAEGWPAPVGLPP